MSDSHAKRPERRSNSLIWRLTLAQTSRSIAIVIATDLLICLLAVGGVILLCGINASMVLEQVAASGVEAPLPGSSLPGSPMLEWTEDSGTSWYSFADDLMGLPLETRYKLQHSVRSYAPYRSLPATEHPSLEFCISAPLPRPERWLRISYDITAPLAVGIAGMVLLALCQIFMVLSGSAKMRRTARNALQPIQDMAFAAQTISYSMHPGSLGVTAPPEPPAGRKKNKKKAGDGQALPLSNTIETINTINAEHLDKRILIPDERWELQGLASAINAMLERLDAAYQSQLRFVSDASHELRTPISVIQGYAGLLDRWGKEDPETLQEAINAIKSEADWMQALVEQLLFLARTDNDSIPLNIVRIDVSALIAEVAREARMIDQSHTYQEDIQDGLFVQGDMQFLKQAVRILSDNSKKYSPEGTKITLGAYQRDKEICIWVADEGVGIPAEDLPRVVERFYRTDTSRTRQTGGTGLGLSIALWIVDSHDGHLDIVSREGIGTRMTIALPLSPA